jgi:hypothetical protein
MLSLDRVYSTEQSIFRHPIICHLSQITTAGTISQWQLNNLFTRMDRLRKHLATSASCGFAFTLAASRSSAATEIRPIACESSVERTRKNSISIVIAGKPGPSPLTYLVAKKIIELAQRGERDPDPMRQQALKAFGQAASVGSRPIAILSFPKLPELS